MGKFQRDKGAAWEREVVRMAREYGLTARRTAMNQTQDGSDTYGDVQIGSLKCECKHHRDIIQWIEMVNSALLGKNFRPGRIVAGWLKGHDCLIVKQSGGWTPLVIENIAPTYPVTTFDEFLKAQAILKLR